MSETAVLIAGIGSPHGDDRFGWEVIRKLTELLPGAALDPVGFQEKTTPVMLRALAAPIGLFNDLGGTDQLIVCDACSGLSQPGECRTLNWPTDQISHLRGSGSHDISLVETLRLAERIKQLPASVTIWVAERSPTQDVHRPTEVSLSSPVAAAVERVASQIAEKYGHA